MITARNEKSEDLASLVSIYDYANDPEAALYTLDRYEKVAERDQSTVGQRVKFLMALGKHEQAYETMRAFCAAHPDNLNYRLEMADLYVRTGRPDEGYHIIQNVLEAHPGHGGALISLLAYYETKRDRVQFERQFTAVMRSTEVLPRQKVAIFESMSRAVEAGQYDKYLLYRHGVEAISLPGGSYPMPEVVSDFVHAAKLPKDSLAAPARALLEADSTNREARWQVLRSALLNNRVDEADSISAAGRRLHPEDLTFYYFGGLARLTMGHSAEAIALFHAALPHVTPESDSTLVSTVYTAIGDAQQGRGHLREAFAAYDTALIYDRDNVECLNNYAYHLAVAGQRLHAALRMAQRAVEISPSEISYIDTYAWTLYRNRKYKAAQVQMDEVINVIENSEKLTAPDATTAGYYDRAGDIYAALGRRKEAVDYWKRALQFSDDAALNKRLYRKLKHRRS